jgi:hypothetical protein
MIGGLSDEPSEVLGAVDEVETWHAQQMEDPEYRYWYLRVSAQIACSHPRRLCIDGREYRRRQRARRRRT